MIDKQMLGSAQKMWIIDAVLMAMLSWELLTLNQKSLTCPLHLQKSLGQF